MSVSRRAAKPRYVLTRDRDRIAMAVGALCGFGVLIISIFVQRHQLLETIFRAAVAMVVTYAATYMVVWLAAYLLDTQSIVEDVTPETEAEEPEAE